MVEKLTAHNLKLLSLQFLRRFYRDFPRSGAMETVLDMRGEGGIIADGWLSFSRPDGTLFEVTVETTTAQMAQELRYVPPLRKITGDAFALSAVMVTLIFWMAYTRQDVFFYRYSQGYLATLIFSGVLVLMLVYVVLFWQSRRYRYIYAIEQFKQYHADQQWIAMAADVFPNPEDKYLTELKNQCMKYGIGLLSVQDSGMVQLLISPAQMAVSAKKRKVLRWVPLQDLVQKVPFSKWAGMLSPRKLSTYLSEGTQVLMLRFGNNIRVQIWIGLLAISSVFGVFLFENLKSPITKVNEKAYARKLESAMADFKPEARVLDSVVTSWVLPAYTDIRPYLDAREDRIPTWSVPAFLLKAPDKELPNLEAADFSQYNCNVFAQQTDVRYFLQLDRYFPLNFALEQAKKLNDLNIGVNCYWLGCFSERTSDFFLVTRKSFPTREGAEKARLALQRTLSRQKIGMDIEILEIIPFKNN
ncbi:MAG: hypothetical protein NWR67_07065 [Saprospiraceae bacterium]|nr:hypothetical protein [Saprospiraceae bacterium]